MNIKQSLLLKYRPIFVIFLLLLIVIVLSYKFKLYAPEYRELTPMESAEVETIRREAYEYAVACSKTNRPALRFEDISWVLMPGSYLDVRDVDGNIRLKGFFNPSDSTIYIPFTERNTKWLAAHEALHAIGYFAEETGKHPDVPFRTCGLLREQN